MAVISSPWPADVLFVCSSGGHLAQLYKLRPWWGSRRRRWATFDTADARSLLEGEDIIVVHFPTTRHLANLIRNALLAAKVLVRKRPDVIISDGAAVAFPFFVVARLLRIPCVYVEVLDRIDSRTLTGRLCAPLANLFLVQVPQQQALYPSSRLVGELL